MKKRTKVIITAGVLGAIAAAVVRRTAVALAEAGSGYRMGAGAPSNAERAAEALREAAKPRR